MPTHLPSGFQHKAVMAAFGHATHRVCQSKRRTVSWLSRLTVASRSMVGHHAAKATGLLSARSCSTEKEDGVMVCTRDRAWHAAALRNVQTLGFLGPPHKTRVGTPPHTPIPSAPSAPLLRATLQTGCLAALLALRLPAPQRSHHRRRSSSSPQQRNSTSDSRRVAYSTTRDGQRCGLLLR